MNWQMRKLQVRAPEAEAETARFVTSKQEGGLKSILCTFTAMALAALAADVCHAAPAGPINKKAASAPAAARPLAPKGGRPNLAHTNSAIGQSSTAGSQNGAGAAAVAARNAPSVSAAATPQGANALPAAGAARNGAVANPIAVAPQTAGLGPVGPTGPAGLSGSAKQTGPVTKISSVAPTASPPPGAAGHDAIVSGASVKHSTSALAAIGGATVGKGAAAVNGTSMRPKKH